MHFAQQIKCDAVGFCPLNTECMERQHYPFGEPATPFEVGGFVQITDN